MPAVSKTFTIWRYGITFYANKESVDREFTHDMKIGAFPIVMYCGHVDHIPDDVAEAVAEISPRFSSYFDAAMMALYTFGRSRTKGTEDPATSIRSMCGMPYVSIYRIYDDASMYPATPTTP